MRWLIPVSGIHDNGLERYGDNFPCRASFAFTSLLCARKMKGKGWVEFFFWREKWHFHDPLGIRGIGRHCCILAGTRCPDCWLRFPPRITGDIERIATFLSLSLFSFPRFFAFPSYRDFDIEQTSSAFVIAPLPRVPLSFDRIYRRIYNLRRLRGNAMSMFVACQPSLICERSIGNRLENRDVSNLYRAKKF